MRLSPALRAAFGLTLAVILGTTVFSYRSTRRLFEESRGVVHTQEVRAALMRVRSDLQDAETASRGFLITGDDAQLAPYGAATRELPAAVERLRTLTGDNAAQRARMALLDDALARELADLRSAIEARRREGFDAARTRISAGTGTELVANVRGVLRDMDAEEDRLLVQRRRDADVAARFTGVTFVIAAVLAVALMSLLLVVLRRHLAERERLLGAERSARAAAEEAGAARARSETELHDAVEVRETVIANMGEGLYTVDTNGCVTSINAAGERLLGWTAADLLGRKMHDTTHYQRPDGSPFPAEECAGLQVLRTGVAVTDHADVFIRRDGTFMPVTYSASRLVGERGIAGLVVVFRDETARKRADAERDALLAATQRARTEAEAASRAKDAFLATISHELRTPLSPILAWTAMLERDTLDPAQRQKALATIRRCARAQTQLIEELLDVSRIVSGKLRLEVRPVDLRAVIEAAVDVVRPAADARGIRLQSILDTETAPVSGDATRLQQVVWNLVSNAIKFTPRDGRVTVVLERVNSHVEIAVSDTGQGIDPAFLPHVFERFQQADSTSTRQHMGLGLGLAIARHIVEAHGGSIHAESPGPGRGAVFTVKLPLMLISRTAGEAVRRHPTVAETDDAPPRSLADVRVLVVDDEPESNEVVRAVLADAGAEVRVAASSEQAMEILGRWSPEVLVTDIGMPGEDGYGLLARIRARETDGRSLPAIALTAYASVDDRVRLLSAGFAMHVVKPVEPAELVAVVARVAGR